MEDFAEGVRSCPLEFFRFEGDSEDGPAVGAINSSIYCVLVDFGVSFRHCSLPGRGCLSGEGLGGGLNPGTSKKTFVYG